MSISEHDTSMQERNLGPSGPAVSAIGLGCVRFVAPPGSADKRADIVAIRAAIDLGITFLDAASSYGGGRTEEIVGQAVRGRREEVFLASKVGLRVDSERQVDGRPEHIVSTCDASLRRLQVDLIDLYYLHRVDPSVPVEDSIGALSRLVDAGKVRYLGISEAQPQSIRRAHAVHPLTAYQMDFSLWSREAEFGVLDTCRSLGLGFVAYWPLGQGFLSGAVRSLADLPADDRRRRAPRFAEENLRQNVTLLGPLERVAQRSGATPAQIALAWLLSRGPDIIPIPGSRSPAHMMENVAAVDLRLSSDDLAELEVAFPPAAVAGTRMEEFLLKRVGL
jgi:aryl-alcohol dehydrogenase-like predicted oxidoreductase